MIPAYRPRKEVDRVLAKVGSDFQYDDTHFLHDEDAAEDDGATASEASDDDAPEVTAVAEKKKSEALGLRVPKWWLEPQALDKLKRRTNCSPQCQRSWPRSRA